MLAFHPRMNAKRYLLFCSMLLTCPAVLGQADSAANEGKKLHPIFEAGVMTGGEISDGLFIYRNAKTVEASLNFKSGGRIYYGAGGGIEIYKQDYFIPLFFQFKGMTKKKSSSSFMSVQAGYGITSTNKEYRIMNVKTQGGLFFSPGIGFKLKLDRHLVLLSINYKHQFTRLTYTGVSTDIYRHEANLHMVSFKAGLVID